MNLDKIYETQASLDETDSLSILKSLGDMKDRWILYSHCWCEPMVKFVENYINTHATIPGVISRLYSKDPLQIGRITQLENVERIDFMLYENGCVVVETVDPDTKMIHLWIELKTAKLFNYPSIS